MCDCLDRINKLLEEKHGLGLTAPTIGPRCALIETYVKVKKRGRMPRSLSAIFCPFCGVRYEG